MRLAGFDALSFDCYGTLIDWERGIAAALEPLARRSGRPIDAGERLAAFSRHEHPEQARTPDAPYPEVLARVHHAIARDWGVEPDPELAARFGASVGSWPPFPDSADALARLARRYRLFVLSNVDRESFAASSAHLGVTFDGVCTAQDIGSYKPAPRNFEYLVEHVRSRHGIPPERLLHVAESLFHDIAPAHAFGLATAWIHRRAAKGGFGATRPVENAPRPDFYFRSLAEMADAVEAEGKS